MILWSCLRHVSFLREKGLIGKKKALAEMMACRAGQYQGSRFNKKGTGKVRWQLKMQNLILYVKLKKRDLRWKAKFKYNMIVGSFITPEYAKELSEEYRKQGYDTRIIKVDDSKFEFVQLKLMKVSVKLLHV